LEAYALNFEAEGMDPVKAAKMPDYLMNRSDLDLQALRNDGLLIDDMGKYY
jgi:hypothetical protein